MTAPYRFVRNCAFLIVMMTLYMSLARPVIAQSSDVTYEPVKFYRIRIEFDTRADRAVIDLSSKAEILTGWQIDLRGNPDKYIVHDTRMALTQSARQANTGEEVGITADFAFSPGCYDKPIKVKLRESVKNSSTVYIYHVSGETESLIGNINKAGEISIHLDQAKDLVLYEVQMPVVNLEKMVWAFYYPYYRLDSWDHSDLLDTPLEQYSSADPEAISKHIDQAKSAGIDGFLVSWWGPNGESDKNLRRMLKIAEKKDFKIAIYVEIIKYPSGEILSQDELDSWIKYILTTYPDEPSYYRVFDRPLIVIWSTISVPLEEWREVIRDLREDGFDASYLYLGFDRKSLALFDGYHVYCETQDASEFKPASKKAYYYPLYASNGIFTDNRVGGMPKIMCATVRPGNDDRRIPGRVGKLIEREGGNRYRFTWKKAIESDPHWILITSWNEWWEHTYIEPSQLYGDQYLKITREYSDKWKNQ